MSYKTIISNLEAVFEANADTETATSMEAYMKNHFSFYGIKSKRRQELAKPFMNQLLKEHRSSYKEIAMHLWVMDQRDFHYVAMEFLKRTYKEWDITTIDLIETLITQHSWWDSVDFLAAHLMGKYIQLFYPDDYSIMDNWNEDENMWVIRTSLLFQLKYKDKTDWPMLQKHILKHDSSSEFFIRKAIGWVLREYSKTNAQAVTIFVQNNPQLSGLSKREALKWLNRQK